MLGALVVKGQSGEGGREALEQLEVLGDAGAVASTERGVGLDDGGQMYVAEVAAVQALYESRGRVVVPPFQVWLRRRFQRGPCQPRLLPQIALGPGDFALDEPRWILCAFRC